MSGQPSRRKGGDADPRDGRDETVDERMDRNWNELLQELRVTQTGTQIITGFLLTIAFQPKFAELDGFQRGTYLVLVLVAALTTALALAPVNLHRAVFRRHRKGLTVQIGHQILRVTLLGVGLVLAGTILLVFDVTVGRSPALWATAAMVVVLAGLALLPRFLRGSSATERKSDLD